MSGLHTRVLLLALLVGCAGGCGAEDEPAAHKEPPEPDPENPCVPGPSPSLEIGEGEFEYLPLAEGATIELIHGPQGGVHTLTGLLAKDVDASEELTVQLDGYLNGERVGGSVPYLNFRCAGGEGQMAWGVFLFWDPAPEDLHMQTVRIEAQFTDASGTVVSASKEAVIYDPTLE